jgi:hypothetical protein
MRLQRLQGMKLRSVHRAAQSEQRRHLRPRAGLDLIRRQADGADDHRRARPRCRRPRARRRDRLGRPLAPLMALHHCPLGRCPLGRRPLGDRPLWGRALARRALRRGRVAARRGRADGRPRRSRAHRDLLAACAARHRWIDRRRSGPQVHARMFRASTRPARTGGLAGSDRGGLDGRTNSRAAAIAARVCRDDRILHVCGRRSRNRICRLRLARGVRAAFGVTKNLGQESQRRVPLPEVSASRSPVAVSERRGHVSCRPTPNSSHQPVLGALSVQAIKSASQTSREGLDRTRIALFRWHVGDNPGFLHRRAGAPSGLARLLAAASNANAVAQKRAESILQIRDLPARKQSPERSAKAAHPHVRVCRRERRPHTRAFARSFDAIERPPHAPRAGRSRLGATLDARARPCQLPRDRIAGIFSHWHRAVLPSTSRFFPSGQNRDGVLGVTVSLKRRMLPCASAGQMACGLAGPGR